MLVRSGVVAFTLITCALHAPAQPSTSSPLAVVEFTASENLDARDAWMPTAIAETLAWRLRRAPGLTVIPAARAHQSRQELAEKADDPPPPWSRVLPLIGARLSLHGVCSGTPHEAVIDLELTPIGESNTAPARTRVGPGRLFEVIDDATRWTLSQLGVKRIDKATEQLILAPPAKSPTALRYHTMALTAARRADLREAAYYSQEAVDADPSFASAVMLLAKLELKSAALAQANAHLRQVKLLAAGRNDVFTEAEFEVARGLTLMAERSFDPARQRFENALKLSRESGDPYGQLAAMNALCDYWLNCPSTNADVESADGSRPFDEDNLRQAADWETRVLDLLTELGDHVAEAPGANKLALICERLNDPERAVAAHQRTIAAARKIGSTRTEATGCLFLGQWYRRQERWPEALETIQRCLTLAPDDARPTIRVSLAEVYRGMSRPRDALAEYEGAYAAIADSDDLMTQFRCLHASAELHMELGEKDQAVKRLSDALDIATVMELPEEKNIRKQLAQWKGQKP